MRWAYQVKYKLKAAFALAAILLVIITANFFTRAKFADVDESMTSIFNDRLKPSGYLYKISHHLYEKKIAQDQLVAGDGHFNTLSLQQHDNAITLLVQQYEKTYLTPEERSKWLSLKKHLAGYDKLAYELVNNNNNSPEAIRELNRFFNLAMIDLDSLNSIQMGEGASIQKNAHADINNTMLLSTLEMSLLIVLGLFTLVLLSVTDKTIFKQYPKEVGLN